jgi:hypothetical protein
VDGVAELGELFFVDGQAAVPGRGTVAAMRGAGQGDSFTYRYGDGAELRSGAKVRNGANVNLRPWDVAIVAEN